MKVDNFFFFLFAHKIFLSHFFFLYFFFFIADKIFFTFLFPFFFLQKYFLQFTSSFLFPQIYPLEILSCAKWQEPAPRKILQLSLCTFSLHFTFFHWWGDILSLLLSLVKHLVLEEDFFCGLITFPHRAIYSDCCLIFCRQHLGNFYILCENVYVGKVPSQVIILKNNWAFLK